MSTVSGLLNSTRIRGIQRGTISITRGATDTTIYLANTTITQVDTNKTELRFLGSTASDSTSISYAVGAAIKLINSTTIQIYAYGGNSRTINASWELTEYM